MSNKEVTNIVLNATAALVFGEFLEDEDITEIAINKPGEIWTEKHGVWTQHLNDKITLELLENFAPAFAGFNNTGISDINPIVSGTLETGERVQVVYPPAGTKGTISVTLRKPSQHVFSHQSYQSYIENGFYDFLELPKYNNTRPHSGKFCYGKTPMQTFKDSIKMAQDKSINSYLSDSSFAA